MHIGQLARRSGVPIDTVRYYERQRLLPTAHRSAAGYRLFHEQAVQRLHSSGAQKQWVSRSKKETTCCPCQRSVTGTWPACSRPPLPAADIDQRLRALQRMRDGLARLLDACPGHGALTACPVLVALQEDAE